MGWFCTGETEASTPTCKLFSISHPHAVNPKSTVQCPSSWRTLTRNGHLARTNWCSLLAHDQIVSGSKLSFATFGDSPRSHKICRATGYSAIGFAKNSELRTRQVILLYRLIGMGCHMLAFHYFVATRRIGVPGSPAHPKKASCADHPFMWLSGFYVAGYTLHTHLVLHHQFVWPSRSDYKSATVHSCHIAQYGSMRELHRISYKV